MSIKRFVEAHESGYDVAIKELKNGKKETHWMFYIFPQIHGLGLSSMAMMYAIKSLSEAQDYMANEYLNEHMITLCNTLLELKTNNPKDIFDDPDDLKLRSSMTLFKAATPQYDVFQKVLDKYYGGKDDDLTLEILEHNKQESFM